MNISYAVCTHDEGPYVVDLLNRLGKFHIELPDSIYEIVIQDDFSKDPATQAVLRQATEKYPFIKVSYRKHEGDFAAHKNALIEKCTGDWIVNLDADEWMSEELMSLIPLIIESNPEVEAYWLPRVNTVDGLTLSHVQKWGWVLSTLDGFVKVRDMEPDSEEYKLLKEYGYIVNEENGFVTYKEPIILYPDVQMRLFKNDHAIRWVGKVHERLTGFKNFTHLPIHPDYAIRHFKSIDRQEEQQKLYNKILDENKR
jgi:glycosyltransferase involved in cell wall biosynthesis